MSKITINKKHASSLKTIRTGPKRLDLNFSEAKERKTLQESRMLHRENNKSSRLNNFKTEQEYNKWADYLFNYKLINGGEGLGFDAPIQGAGIGDVVKGGSGVISRGIARSLPSIFRSVLNYEGPISMIPSLYNQIIRNRAQPQSIRDLTDAQIRAYTFGSPHYDEYKDGAGNLADYIREGGDVNNPEVAPFMELFEEQANQVDIEGAADLVARALGPIPQPPPQQPAQPPQPQQPAQPPQPQQPAQPPQPQQPAQPAQPQQPAAPINGVPNMPPLIIKPPVRPPPNVRPPSNVRTGPGGEPLPPARNPLAPGRRPWRILPIIPPWFPAPPPSGPEDIPKRDEPRRPDGPKKDEPEKPEQPEEPEEPQGVEETATVDDHKLQSGEGYGYKRPEFSTDMGLESLVLTNKENLMELSHWDRFDEVTDAIYTLDNPLYKRQLEQDAFRYSGIAKDPYFYLGEEYKKHNAPDPFKIYATQGTRHDANNLSTALGQVRKDPNIHAGPQQRGAAFRTDPSYENDMIERIYENPDLEELIEDNVNYKNNEEEIKQLEKAFNKSVNISQRWTTETSDYIDK
jgi:hypothetical protein